MKKMFISGMCFTVLLLAVQVPTLSFATGDEEKAKDPVIEKVQAYIAEQTSSGALQKGTTGGWKSRLPKFPAVQFPATSTYIWKLKTTMGEIEIEFLPDVAPNHVANFIYLTELGFFDDLKFHRVIPGFMAQGGCPQGTGRGNPGYRFAGEFDSSVKHTRGGLLSMANSGPNTDGSQFFLTFKTTPWLDGKHTIFGKVRAGEDTLKAIEKVGSGSGQTTSAVKIEKATVAIETKGASKKKVKKKVEKKAPAKKEPTQKENR